MLVTARQQNCPHISMSHYPPHQSDRRSGSSCTSTSPQPQLISQLAHSSPASSSSTSSHISSDHPRDHHSQMAETEAPTESRNLDQSEMRKSLATRRLRSQQGGQDEDEEMDEDENPQSNSQVIGSNKRTRKLLTVEQSNALHELLAKTHFPSTSAREEIAKQLNITPRKVQVFFQNKRQKARRHTLSNSRQSAGTSASLSSDLPQTSSSHQQHSSGYHRVHSPPRSAPLFGPQSSHNRHQAPISSYFARDTGTAGSHRDASLPSSNHSLHPSSLREQQFSHPHHQSQPAHHHLRYQPTNPSSSSQFSPELRTPSSLEVRSLQQHPSSLSLASGNPGARSTSSSIARTYSQLASSDSRRRAYSDAPHRPDATYNPGPSSSFWDERSQNEAEAPRRLAPLPQGRRIELPPIPAGLVTSPGASLLQNSTSRLNSPPLLSAFPSSLPPLRISSKSSRLQGGETHVTDEERSNSSSASSQFESVDAPLTSRLQHPREGSLPASPFPSLSSSFSADPRSRSDSDPFLRERGMTSKLARTPPKGGSTHSYFSSYGSPPVIAHAARPSAINQLSHSQDSAEDSSQTHSTSPSSQSSQSSQRLPPLSSGLATITDSNTSLRGSSPTENLQASSSAQFRSPQSSSSSLSRPKRPAEAVRLPSFSQLNIDVESRDDHGTSQKMQRLSSGNSNGSIV